MERVMLKPKSTIMWRGAMLGCGLLVLFFGVYLVTTLPSSGLKDPIEAQLDAIRMEDPATAYSYTSHSFQDATSLEAFKRFIGQYSSLRNNSSIAFNQREIKNGVGVVHATLTSRGGITTPVLYQLVKEHKRWKIESMVITPQGDDEPIADSTPAAAKPTPLVATDTTTTADTQAATTAAPEAEAAPAAPAAPVAETPRNTYQDSNFGFSLTYPDTWQYVKTDSNATVFTGKSGVETNGGALTIQPLAATTDQPAQSVQQATDSNENALKNNADDFKVVEDGLLPPHSNQNERLHGQYTLYSYTINNQSMKQLHIVYFKSPARALYTISFVAPEAEFDADLPAARAMIASFKVS